MAEDKGYWAGETQWAEHDQIPLLVMTCIISDRPFRPPFFWDEDSPWANLYRRLKNAFKEGRLKGRVSKGRAQVAILITREDLRSFATNTNDDALLAFLKRWDELNPPSASASEGE
jgi:hypothetical protein